MRVCRGGGCRHQLARRAKLGRVADEPELDEVARLTAVFSESSFVWRIVGVRPSGEEPCEVKLHVLGRAGGDRYLLRSIVVELDRITKVANHLFQASPPDRSFRWEDITFATLEDALRCARTLRGFSRAVPLPEQTQLVHSVWSRGSLSRSTVRSQVIGFPSRPAGGTSRSRSSSGRGGC